MSRSVFITGAAGFIGSAAVRHFAARGERVVAIDMASPVVPFGPGVQFVRLPLPSDGLVPLLRESQPDVLLHCAGRASVPASFVDPRADFDASVSLTFEVLEALRVAAPRCRFLLLSSAAVYGNPQTLPIREDGPLDPISPYGFHKLQAESLVREYARVHDVRGASLRVFSAFGVGLERQVIWDVCRKVMASEVVTLQGTGEESRDFVHVDDVVAAADAVSQRGELRGEAYNVADGVERRIADVATELARTLRPGTRFVFDGRLPAGTPRRWCGDVSRLRATGFAPTGDFAQRLAAVATAARSGGGHAD